MHPRPLSDNLKYYSLQCIGPCFATTVVGDHREARFQPPEPCFPNSEKHKFRFLRWTS